MNKIAATTTILLSALGLTGACDLDSMSADGLPADEVGETGQELYDPATPPTPVATDACDESTFAGVNWVSQSSAHVTVNYLPGTAAERDIASILSRREAAYASIRTALGITAEPAITVYLSPNRLAAGAKGRGMGNAYPGQDRYEAVYAEQGSFEAAQPGNLMTRTLEYYIDPANARRIPLLSAGLAEYLDQSGRAMHDAYALRLHAGAETRVRVASFEATDVNGKNTGRAGSLVQFLIDRYGMTTFLTMFKASAVSTVGTCSARSATYGCINSAAALTSMMDGLLQSATGERWSDVAPSWKAAVDARLAVVNPTLPKRDRLELENLVNLMDQAIVTGDAALYRSTMEGFYCEWGGEAVRSEIAQRTIDSYGGSSTTVMRIYGSGVQNFSTARVLVRRIDERGMSSVATLSAEKLPQGWRITYGPDWW